VHHLLDPLMAKSASLGAGLDWKTSLQELAAADSLGMPEYRVSEEGPDHEKTFTASAVVGTFVLGEGVGRSKKEAEQRAAEEAWKHLSDRADNASKSTGAAALDAAPATRAVAEPAVAEPAVAEPAAAAVTPVDPS
jgi:ribonuclease-3